AGFLGSLFGRLRELCSELSIGILGRILLGGRRLALLVGLGRLCGLGCRGRRGYPLFLRNSHAKTKANPQEAHSQAARLRLYHVLPPIAGDPPAGLKMVRMISDASLSTSACNPLRAAAMSCSRAASASRTCCCALARASARASARACCACCRRVSCALKITSRASRKRCS